MKLFFLLSCTSEPSDTSLADVSILDELFTAEEQTVLRQMSAPQVEPSDSTNVFSTQPEAVAFGKLLFSATELSSNDEVSCATCHDPEHGFSDTTKLSEGIDSTGLHSPHLQGIGASRWMFWNGRCDTLWCQATGPIEHPGEMGMDRVALVHKLQNIETLKTAYQDLAGPLPDPSAWPTNARPVPDEPDNPLHLAWGEMAEVDQNEATRVLVNIAKFIAAYEMTIPIPSASIDDFLAEWGTEPELVLDRLSQQQEEGLRLFIGEGQCHLCHSGPMFTNSEFHNIGLGEREWLDPSDLGRYDGIAVLQGNEFNSAGEWSDDINGEKAEMIFRLNQGTEQLGAYKTPSLRGVSGTGPWMHGGHFDTLRAVVDHYSEMEETPLHGHAEDLLQPLDWSDDQKDSVVAFLLMLGTDEQSLGN